MKQYFTLMIKTLMTGIAISMLSQVFFGRGLSLDGVHILYKMIITKTFYFIEIARMITHFFQHWPAGLFINYAPSNSLSILIAVFSFGLIWIHIISFAGCYYILPENKKYYIFFPFFAFLTGPLTGLGVSIGASLSVASYIWLTAFVIYYSDFSFKIHKFLFILTPLPLLLSHEMMSYMAWPLIFLSVLKLKKETDLVNRFSIKLLIAFLLVVSILQTFFIIFPVDSELHNRAEFFKSLFQLEFFIKIQNGQIDFIYPAAITSFFLLIFPFGQYLLKIKSYKIFSTICLTFIVLFGATALILPFYELFDVFKLTDEKEARVWISCIALPSSLLIWWLFENNKIQLRPSFFIACGIVLISLTGWRVGSDYQFYQFQRQFSDRLSHCKGIVEWSEVTKAEQKKIFNPGLFDTFNQGFKYTSSSLIYPRRLNIIAVIKSETMFAGCYAYPPYGMCENDVDTTKNKFFNFSKLLYYEQNKQTGCY